MAKATKASVYSLVLLSNKPEAKVIQDWVTGGSPRYRQGRGLLHGRGNAGNIPPQNSVTPRSYIWPPQIPPGGDAVFTQPGQRCTRQRDCLVSEIFQRLDACLLRTHEGIPRVHPRGTHGDQSMSFPFSFDASRHHIDLRIGSFDLFAQRESAPATSYGFRSSRRGAGVLDLPGWSVAYAFARR